MDNQDVYNPQGRIANPSWLDRIKDAFDVGKDYIYQGQPLVKKDLDLIARHLGINRSRINNRWIADANNPKIGTGTLEFKR